MRSPIALSSLNEALEAAAALHADAADGPSGQTLVRATEKFSCPLIVLSFILTSLRADWLEVKLAVHASRLLSDAAGASRALPRAGSVAAGVVRAYVFSTDHKMIARQFLFLGLVMMLLGGLLAMLIRWELAWPETSIRWLR